MMMDLSDEQVIVHFDYHMAQVRGWPVDIHWSRDRDGHIEFETVGVTTFRVNRQSAYLIQGYLLEIAEEDPGHAAAGMAQVLGATLRERAS